MAIPIRVTHPNTIPLHAHPVRYEAAGVLGDDRVIFYADKSIYPIAYSEWYANFYATTNVPGSGVTVIDLVSTVSKTLNWVRSNDDPLKDAGPVWNSNVDWQ